MAGVAIGSSRGWPSSASGIFDISTMTPLSRYFSMLGHAIKIRKAAWGKSLMETEGEMLELTTSRDIKPILTPFNMFILITPILMIIVDVFPSSVGGGHCWSDSKKTYCEEPQVNHRPRD